MSRDVSVVVVVVVVVNRRDDFVCLGAGQLHRVQMAARPEMVEHGQIVAQLRAR